MFIIINFNFVVVFFCLAFFFCFGRFRMWWVTLTFEFLLFLIFEEVVSSKVGFTEDVGHEPLETVALLDVLVRFPQRVDLLNIDKVLLISQSKHWSPDLLKLHFHTKKEPFFS